MPSRFQSSTTSVLPKRAIGEAPPSSTTRDAEEEAETPGWSTNTTPERGAPPCEPTPIAPTAASGCPSPSKSPEATALPWYASAATPVLPEAADRIDHATGSACVAEATEVAGKAESADAPGVAGGDGGTR